MKLNHLALSVRDQDRSIEFYARYFGFDPESARGYPDGVIIVRGADGFSLALGPEPGDAARRDPGFPHFGFEMETPDEARALRARLVEDGVELVEDEDTPDYVGCKCLDPDGHVIELAWEP